MELLNISMLNEDIFKLINKFKNNNQVGGLEELDQLPDPPKLPGMGGFLNMIKFFIYIAVAFFVILFLPAIIFGLMIYFCWKFFNKMVLKKVKSI